ncbi:uncharacterized protein LOC110443827 [Mizuhopecten yessoensis]|uniref:uncharacterized protein LOC110443827 n=1 Tax=Mizuhopecten yessoensis TaxID=6573 RepID=UPI000B459147|nr:uncharacterized protein LOC110443827 [Mizuhopecten yessoensis]
MLAFTVLLVACVVAGSSATKSSGISLGQISGSSGSISRQLTLAPRMSMQQYRLSRPSIYTRRSVRRTYPAPKYRSYSSGAGSYATNMYNDNSQGLLGGNAYLSAPSYTGSSGSYIIPTAYQTGFSSPAFSGSSQQGSYVMPSTYQTGGTYNIGLGAPGTTLNDARSSLFLLNQPTYSSGTFGSSQLMAPISPKTGHMGSY